MLIILLAAGQSKRIKPIKDKTQLSFTGKTLIEEQLSILKNQGISNIIIVVNKNNLESISQIVSSEVILIEQKNLEAGMQGAILACTKLIKNQDLLIINSNDIISPEVYQKISSLKESDPQIDGILLAKKVENYFPGGYLTVDQHHRINSIIEKPTPGSEPSQLVNIVCHYHRHSYKLIQELNNAKSSHDDLYEVALDKLFKINNYQALSYENYWISLKYPWHVLDVMDHFLNQQKKRISSSAQIAKTAVINGPVIIGNNVKILDHSTIIGPAFIGDNCLIANNSLVRKSIINKNSVIGFSTEIARSYLGENVWTHKNYFGDSVIDNNCSFGAGTISGNVRFDKAKVLMTIENEKINSQKKKLGIFIGQNVKTGINTSFMPGKKIGQNSFIGANTVVNQDIPPETLAYESQELIKCGKH